MVLAKMHSLHPLTLASLLTRPYGATELHNNSIGANDGHELVMILVDIYSHACMIYSMSVTAHSQPFLSRTLSLPTATGG